MDTVYIETSIISHATAWPSSDIQIATMQKQARDWWALERPKFDLVTSQLVITEASVGDLAAAADRMKLLEGLPLVPINSDAQTRGSPTFRLVDAAKSSGGCASRCRCGCRWRKISTDTELSTHRERPCSAACLSGSA
jgi:hypothetical protein